MSTWAIKVRFQPTSRARLLLDKVIVKCFAARLRLVSTVATEAEINLRRSIALEHGLVEQDARFHMCHEGL